MFSIYGYWTHGDNMLKELNARILRFLESSDVGVSGEADALTVEDASSLPVPNVFAIRKTQKVDKPIGYTSISLDGKWAAYSFEEQVCIMDLTAYEVSRIDIPGVRTNEKRRRVYVISFHTFTHESNEIIVVWKPVDKSLTTKLSFIEYKEQKWALKETCEIQRDGWAQTSCFQINCLYPLQDRPGAWIVEIFRLDVTGERGIMELILFNGDPRNITIESRVSGRNACFIYVSERYKVGKDCLLIQDISGVYFYLIGNDYIQAIGEPVLLSIGNDLIPLSLSSDGRHDVCVCDNKIFLHRITTNGHIHVDVVGFILDYPDCKKVSLSPDARLLCFVQGSSLVILDVARWVDTPNMAMYRVWGNVNILQRLDFADNPFKQLHWSNNSVVYQGEKSIVFIEHLDVMKAREEFKVFILNVYNTMVSLVEGISVDMILEVIKHGMCQFGYYDEHWDDVEKYIQSEHSTWFSN